MKTLSTALLSAVILTAALSAPALAQGPGDGPGRFGGMLMLLAQPSVQDELKVSDEQKTKLKAAAEKQRASFGELRDLDRQERAKKMEDLGKQGEKLTAEILDASQLKRLKQIAWQQQGPLAVEHPEVAAALNLTDDQKTKLKSIQEESRKEMREVFQGGGDRAEMRTKGEAIRKAAGEKITALLTSEQSAKWKELLGEPFKGELQRPGRNRRPQN